MNLTYFLSSVLQDLRRVRQSSFPKEDNADRGLSTRNNVKNQFLNRS